MTGQMYTLAVCGNCFAKYQSETKGLLCDMAVGFPTSGIPKMTQNRSDHSDIVYSMDRV